MDSDMDLEIGEKDWLMFFGGLYDMTESGMIETEAPGEITAKGFDEYVKLKREGYRPKTVNAIAMTNSHFGGGLGGDKHLKLVVSMMMVWEDPSLIGRFIDATDGDFQKYDF